MSLDVSVQITGQLENIRNHDLAEHISKIVNEAIQEAADKYEGSTVGIGTPAEYKKISEGRPILGSEPFRPWGEERGVSLNSYIHIPAPNED